MNVSLSELILFFLPMLLTGLALLASSFRIRSGPSSTTRVWYIAVLLLALQSIFNLFVAFRLRPCSTDTQSEVSGVVSYGLSRVTCWDDRIMPFYLSILLVALAFSVGIATYRWRSISHRKSDET